MTERVLLIRIDYFNGSATVVISNPAPGQSISSDEPLKLIWKDSYSLKFLTIACFTNDEMGDCHFAPKIIPWLTERAGQYLVDADCIEILKSIVLVTVDISSIISEGAPDATVPEPGPTDSRGSRDPIFSFTHAAREPTSKEPAETKPAAKEPSRIPAMQFPGASREMQEFMTKCMGLRGISVTQTIGEISGNNNVVINTTRTNW